jgi:hypothetical protein
MTTFLDRYQSEKTWHGRVTVMEIYHCAMLYRWRDWTLSKTAEHFGVSIGLVSENLRLALAIHTNDAILKCESRQDALKKLTSGGRNGKL